ncbi:MAG TPA: RNA-binding cell elongation regulator Jag/EloR [Candidatus Binatia bacterium]|jgi:spoIIIJ-associated protein
MDLVETEGENIDDAIENALKLLGVGRDKITVDIITEGRKGILGFGAQKARVRAQLRKPPLGQTSEPDEATSEPALLSVEAAALAEKAETALREILRLMGVKATLEISTSGDETTLEIHAENSGLLIGRKGQTLEALQYLVTRICGEHYAAEGPHVIVDIEKYRERRRKMLEDMALRLGEKAKRQRKTVTVEALSAADRRIIHAALQDDPWVSTKSLGQGSYRRLLIIPEGDRKKKDTAPPQQQKQAERAQTKSGEGPTSAEDEDSQ